jgi:hypothetical protein
MRLSERSTVLLPHPDGPMKAVDLVPRDRDRDVFDRQLFAVVDVQIADFDGVRPSFNSSF